MKLVNTILAVLVIKPLLCGFVFKCNNVCENLVAYIYADYSESCFYNPDTSLEIPEVIKKYAGKVETYETTSEDGYILKIFRIPRENPKGVIFLRHSLAMDAKSFLWDGNDSIGFMFWNAGYDVWLNCIRGSDYSSKHVNLTTSDYKYWDFSIHEMGVYDVPAEIELIRKNTNGAKIIFLGHSIGGNGGIIHLALKPQQAKESIKLFIGAATPLNFEHATTPIIQTSGFFIPYQKVAHFLQIGYQVPGLRYLKFLMSYVTRLFTFSIPVGNYVISYFNGWSPYQSDAKFLHYDILNLVSPVSWKTFMHYAQMYTGKTKLQYFDYGKAENLKKYGSETPPRYPLEKIEVPVILVSSNADSLVSEKDTEISFKRLPEGVRVEHIKSYGFNHAQFYFFKNKREILFNKILSLISRF